jgi:hypothetical protein
MKNNCERLMPDKLSLFYFAPDWFQLALPDLGTFEDEGF